MYKNMCRIWYKLNNSVKLQNTKYFVYSEATKVIKNQKQKRKKTLYDNTEIQIKLCIEPIKYFVNGFTKHFFNAKVN